MQLLISLEMAPTKGQPDCPVHERSKRACRGLRLYTRIFGTMAQAWERKEGPESLLPYHVRLSMGKPTRSNIRFMAVANWGLDARVMARTIIYIYAGARVGVQLR